VISVNRRKLPHRSVPNGTDKRALQLAMRREGVCAPPAPSPHKDKDKSLPVEGWVGRRHRHCHLLREGQPHRTESPSVAPRALRTGKGPEKSLPTPQRTNMAGFYIEPRTPNSQLYISSLRPNASEAFALFPFSILHFLFRFPAWPGVETRPFQPATNASGSRCSVNPPASLGSTSCLDDRRSPWTGTAQIPRRSQERRCFAAEVMLTHHPQMGAVGIPGAGFLSLCVNTFCISKLAFWQISAGFDVYFCKHGKRSRKVVA
jgi:hypothetical protein